MAIEVGRQVMALGESLLAQAAAMTPGELDEAYSQLGSSNQVQQLRARQEEYVLRQRVLELENDRLSSVLQVRESLGSVEDHRFGRTAVRFSSRWHSPTSDYEAIQRILDKY